MQRLFQKDRYGMPRIYGTIAYFGVSLMLLGYGLKHLHFDYYEYIAVSGICIGIAWLIVTWHLFLYVK